MVRNRHTHYTLNMKREREDARSNSDIQCTRTCVHVHVHMHTCAVYRNVHVQGQHVLLLTIVSSSYHFSQSSITATSRMGHSCHQQLPRWLSETSRIICFLQPFSEYSFQTAFHIRVVSLNPVEEVRVQSQCSPDTSPVVGHIQKLIVHIKKIVDVCREKQTPFLFQQSHEHHREH